MPEDAAAWIAHHSDGLHNTFTFAGWTCMDVVAHGGPHPMISLLVITRPERDTILEWLYAVDDGCFVLSDRPYDDPYAPSTVTAQEATWAGVLARL